MMFDKNNLHIKVTSFDLPSRRGIIRIYNTPGERL